MIRQSQNYVVIEGILSEMNLTAGKKYRNKQGIEQDTIRGDIKIKVVQDIEGEEKELEVPVNFFAPEFTNAGKSNPSYLNLETVINDMKSIASVGEELADRIRITGAKITMNEYFAPDGRFMTYPRVQGSFVTRIKPEDCAMRATWEMELYIDSMGFRYDREGIETDVFELKGINVGYGEYAEVIPVITSQKNIASGLAATYEKGDTVPLSGRLNFTSLSETVMEEVEIGDPIEKVRTIRISDLVVTGAKSAKDEDAYTAEEIAKVLQEREKRLQDTQNKIQTTQGAEKKAPSATAEKVNLGF